ncbi:MAG: hypothetical protein KAU38_16525, partial [Desulfobacterales bacterium]|nr:hypothetical protein [Desulfobacterales bacterium]
MMVEKIITKSGVVLLVEKRIIDEGVEVRLRMEQDEKCLLHWGLSRHAGAPWQIPPRALWPEGTRAFGGTAVQTPFSSRNNEGRIVIRLDHPPNLSLVAFCLFFPVENRWDNNHGKNYYIKLRKPKETVPEAPGVAGLADQIIEKEMSRNSWTLMHRFNLCYDLLDKVRNNVEGLALIFVWLRFSAIRQLDWQRNYNTKPRELSHSMDRLTLNLADRYTKEPGEQEFIRLILTTMGRGGEGQRVRDEVLNIMHRHHIKEVSGHFLEEWHQKLHNNTTPDDIVICEAYLEFLRSDGNLNLFYKRLEQDSVTKKRLQSYERPIRSHPDFIPHLKEALIPDFEHFLGILKAVHSGTDLGTAIHAARYLFDAEMHGLMNFIWRHQDGREISVCTLVEKITEARRRLTGRFKEDSNNVRDLLFLDLSLEDFLRVVVERNLHLKLSGDQLVELIGMVLENVCFSNDDDEFAHCLRHWARLMEVPRFGREWSLQAEAVLDRLGRALGVFIDYYYRLLQPKAEFLGMAFHADTWTITLFSEEVVRGRPAFVLSMLLRQLDPILRQSAELGHWQVISPGQGTGQVEVVATLKSVQGKSFARPTIIVTGKVAGDEEIPERVTAVITPDVTDIVSHVAIRARNAQVLFATCYDPEMIRQLKSLNGHSIMLSVNAAGDVMFEEVNSGQWSVVSGQWSVESGQQWRVPATDHSLLTTESAYAVSASDFNEKNLGGKSNNLRRLQGKLPERIGLPTSVAVPFGVFERVLAEENNEEIRERYEELTRRVDEEAQEAKGELLSKLRKTILALKAPDDLVSSLSKVMEDTGLPWPANWDDAWMCIKRVWGSKWNERAYLSRRANRIPHEDLFMAVLIQGVVEADYSFVIHTVNPFSGERDEIYAEVVLGLGETLVGNYPGRALSFTCKKRGRDPRLLSFPSKSVGLFGSGLIFRSDSNGEDLAGYAGAG